MIYLAVRFSAFLNHGCLRLSAVLVPHSVTCIQEAFVSIASASPFSILKQKDAERIRFSFGPALRLSAWLIYVA